MKNATILIIGILLILLTKKGQKAMPESDTNSFKGLLDCLKKGFQLTISEFNDTSDKENESSFTAPFHPGYQNDMPSNQGMFDINPRKSSFLCANQLKQPRGMFTRKLTQDYN